MVCFADVSEGGSSNLFISSGEYHIKVEGAGRSETSIQSTERRENCQMDNSSC